MKKLLLVAAVASMMTITGCETAVEAPSINAWRSPDAGSILIFRSTQGRNIDGDSSHATASVSLEIVETGLQYWGKNDVSLALGPEGDTLAFTVDEAGDFWMSLQGPEGWEQFPTGTQGTITVRDLDTTINGDEREIRKTTRTFAGEEYLQFENKEFRTLKIVQNDRHEESSPFWDYLGVSTDTIHFSPDLGFFIRQRSFTQNFAQDTLWSTHSSGLDLNAYILK